MNRPLSKKELALEYNPNLTPHSAVNTLMFWVANNDKLLNELSRTGYRKTQKMLTGEQVALILQYIGEP